jgi:hypothetical protein
VKLSFIQKPGIQPGIALVFQFCKLGKTNFYSDASLIGHVRDMRVDASGKAVVVPIPSKNEQLLSTKDSEQYV